MLSLNATSLPDLPAEVPGPTYDRSKVRTGIVHFGVGGFHRSHQAMYVDRLMSTGTGAGLGHLRRRRPAGRPPDGGRAWPHRTACTPSMVKHPDGTVEARVIGSIVEYLFAPDDPEAVIEKMADRADAGSCR